MKLVNPSSALAVLALLGLSAAPSQAVEILSTEELASHCVELENDPDGADAIFCIRYVQGFIDGAVATDERVTQNVAAEYDDRETFSERAKRTRGVHNYIERRLKRYGPSVYAEFCLGEPVPLREVVDAVTAQLNDAERVSATPQARELVYAVLRETYPCQIDDE